MARGCRSFILALTAEGLAVNPRTSRQRSLLDAEAGGVSQKCPAGCCPHPDSAPARPRGAGPGGCPPDIPARPAPERVAHLYACQGLSTYRVADLAGISRQRVTRMLHRSGVAVKPQGAGRRRSSRSGQYPPEFLAVLYAQLRLSCAEISAVTGVPARTVRDRLVASGVRMRTRGWPNREDRTVLDPARLAVMYLQVGLTAEEIGKALGVSRHLVLRTAHDEGFPVRVGGPPPAAGPAEIELINALYADPQVRRALRRHGLPRVPPGGPIWERFPVALPLNAETARELYVSCGLGIQHIELLTGQPSESVRRLLAGSGTILRGAGGRSPFLRRWRARLATGRVAQ